MEEEKSSDGWWSDILLHPIVLFILKLIFALVVIVICLLIARYIAKKVKNKFVAHSTIEDDIYVSRMGNMIEDMVYYTLFIISIFIWFEIVWFDLAILLWWISFWVWLAFKEILWNMIAWILILTNKEFKLWDIIEIDSWKWYMWVVEEISIRYTLVRLFNKQKVIIPNLDLITYPIKTYTSEDEVRFETEVSVHYNTNLRQVTDIILGTIKKFDFVVSKEKADVLVKKFDNSWIQLDVRYYIDPNWLTAWIVSQSEINKAINIALIENDIVIPYPHTVVTFDKNDKNLLWSLLFLKNKTGK